MGHVLDSEGYWFSVGSYIDGGAFGEYAQANAVRLAYALMNTYGWTLDSVSAWFGAVTYESQFNPAQIEGNLTTPTRNSGVGYIQWTPSDQLISFCEGWGVDWRLTSSQLRKWELERTTTDSEIKQWFVMGQYARLYREQFPNGAEPPSTMNGFTKATLSTYSMLELCAQVIEFYTRPGSWENVDNWKRNEESANRWYEIISGAEPPTPLPTKKKGMPLWMKIRYR